jgi:hypothetical protein
LSIGLHAVDIQISRVQDIAVLCCLLHERVVLPALAEKNPSDASS